MFYHFIDLDRSTVEFFDDDGYVVLMEFDSTILSMFLAEQQIGGFLYRVKDLNQENWPESLRC